MPDWQYWTNDWFHLSFRSIDFFLFLQRELKGGGGCRKLNTESSGVTLRIRIISRQRKTLSSEAPRVLCLHKWLTARNKRLRSTSVFLFRYMKRGGVDENKKWDAESKDTPSSCDNESKQSQGVSFLTSSLLLISTGPRADKKRVFSEQSFSIFGHINVRSDRRDAEFIAEVSCTRMSTGKISRKWRSLFSSTLLTTYVYRPLAKCTQRVRSENNYLSNRENVFCKDVFSQTWRNMIGSRR